MTLRDPMGRVCAVESYAGLSSPAPGTCSAAGTAHGGRTEIAYAVAAAGRKETTTRYGVPDQVTVRVTDALGRLLQVVEDPSGMGAATNYGYDAAGRLVGVDQGGRTRSFSYSTTE